MYVILFLILSIFFLLWGFFLNTATYLFSRYSDKALIKLCLESPTRFFYFKIHKRLYKNDLSDSLVLAASLGANGAKLGCITSLFFLLSQIFPDDEGMFALFYLLSFFFILLMCELLPRLIALRNSSPFFSLFQFTIAFFLTLSLPFQFWIISIIQRKKQLVRAEQGEDRIEKFRETITDLMQSADISSPLHPSEKKLLEAVLKFKDRIVREVMVPRSELFSLSTTTTLKDAATQLVHEGFSRIPIYRGNIDNIIGVLMFKDLFEIYRQCLEGRSNTAILEQPVSSFVKGVIYTPETKQVSQLLQEFRAKQMHMAIVVDEYGGTEGVVTIEDILEEIVGDISDEYDEDHEALYLPQPGGGVWIVDAKMNIYDAENTFNISIPKEGDYDTIGGFIYHKLNEIPEPKTKLICEGFELEILSVTERNIEKVRIITTDM